MLLISIYLFIIGLCIGSFINVCALRYNCQTKATQGRSLCPNCHHQLMWYDLIPVFSWLSLKGQCRYCHNKISPRYMIVELIMAICYVLTFIQYGITYLTIIYLIVITTLIYAALVDFKSFIIPDRTHIIIGICAIATIILYPDTLNSKLLGAIITSVPLFIVAYITQGFGYGDVKLMAVGGLLVGWQLNLFTLVLSSILASIYGIYIMKFKGESSKAEIAFGPYICFSMIVIMLYGNTFLNWYISLL